MEQKKKDKRRGIIATSIFHALMIIAFFIFGPTYQDPPPEEGIAINFGYEDDGSGNTTQAAPEQTAPPPQDPVVDEIEDVVTQDVEDAPSVTEEKPKEKPAEKPVEKPKETKPVEPTPSNRLNNALNNTKNSEDASGDGEGETKGGGDQGDRDGDINSNNRTGGGSGNGDYNLNGRSALSKPKPIYDCEDEGRVIVRVRVDRNGKTIQAEPGINTNTVKTNTTSPCLLKRAKEAALRTTWTPKENATSQQVGYIIYNFSKR